MSEEFSDVPVYAVVNKSKKRKYGCKLSSSYSINQKFVIDEYAIEDKTIKKMQPEVEIIENSTKHAAVNK